MKVLFPIMSFYPAQSGGPSNTIYWMAKELAKYNIEPFVVATDNDIKDPSIIRNKWTTLDSFNVRYTTNFNNKYAFNLTIAAVKKLKEVDIVHFSSLFFPPNLIIAFFAILFDKKIILSTRGELETFALSQGRSKLKVLGIFIYKLICGNIYFHGTSKSEMANIDKTFKNSKGCIEIANFIQLPERIKTHKKNQFLFVGRINRIKALHKIIEGFYLSREFKNTDYTFHIVGTGDVDYEDELRNQIDHMKLGQKITVLGASVEGFAKELLYAESKFLILLSESENFGNVVLEALAHATPTITSYGTPWADLKDKKLGYHIHNDPSDIAKCIDKVLSLTNKEYEAMSEGSYNYVKANFDIKTNIDKWVVLYQGLGKVNMPCT